MSSVDMTLDITLGEGDSNSSQDVEEEFASQGPFALRKPICPYISSTFEDFQLERDVLRNKVFPELNKLCEERGTHYNPIDMQWGDSQVSSNLVVQMCLDMIKRCAPYFICLMGERYGSCRPPTCEVLPSTYEELLANENASWLDKNFVVAATSGHDWILRDTFQNSSITELEVTQAAFLGDSEFCHFYFRAPEHVDGLFADLPVAERKAALRVYESENDNSEIRQRDLKARIIKKGLPIKHFTSVEELAAIVSEDWKIIIDKLYPPLDRISVELYSQRFSEWTQHECYAEERREVFVKSADIENIFTSLSDFANKSLTDSPRPVSGGRSSRSPVNNTTSVSKITSILVLCGERRGCGKSSVLANWTTYYLDQYRTNGARVFTHYVGSSSSSNDVYLLMKRVAMEMRDVFTVNDSDEIPDSACKYNDLYHSSETFLAALSLGPCVLVIDGIDQLGSCQELTTQQVKEMKWLPALLPSTCKIIVSTSKSDKSYTTLMQRTDAECLQISNLNDSNVRKELTEGHLLNYCKNINDSQMKQLINSQFADNPLALFVLANELKDFNVTKDSSTVWEHLEFYLSASTVSELLAKIISRWVKDYSWTSEEMDTESNSGTSANHDFNGWVSDALRLLACSRAGLTVDELLGVLSNMGYCGSTEVTAVEWMVFSSATQGHLYEQSGGIINFANHYFKEAVFYTLFGNVTSEYVGSWNNQLSEPEIDLSLPPKQQARTSSVVSHHTTPKMKSDDLSRKVYHQHLAQYFLTVQFNLRAVEELPWQLVMAGDFEQLHTVITYPKMFLDLSSTLNPLIGRRQELVYYWKLLTEHGYDMDESIFMMIQKAAGIELVDNISEDKSDSEAMSLGGLEGIVTASDGRTSRTKTPLGSSRAASAFSSSKSATEHSVSFAITEIEDYEEIDKPKVAVFLEDKEPWDTFALAELSYVSSKLLSEHGYFKTAETLLGTANELMVENYPLDEMQLEQHYKIAENLGDLCRQKLDVRNATYWYDKALATIDDLLGGMIDEKQQKSAMGTKGQIMVKQSEMLLDSCWSLNHYQRMNNLNRVDIKLRQARKCMRKAGSGIGQANVAYTVGKLRCEQHNFIEAQSLFQQALASREHWFGAEHSLVAEVLNDLAGLLCHVDNAEGNQYQAEQTYRKALHIAHKSLGKGHLVVAVILVDLSKLLKSYTNQQSKKEACTLLEQALHIRNFLLGIKHTLTRSIRSLLSQVQTELRQPHFSNSLETQPTNNRRHSSRLSQRRANHNPASSRFVGSNLTQNTPHIDIVTEQPSFTEERTGEMSASVCEDNEKLQLMHPMRAASTPNTDGQRLKNSLNNSMENIDLDEAQTLQGDNTDDDMMSARVSTVTFQNQRPELSADKKSTKETLVLRNKRKEQSQRSAMDSQVIDNYAQFAKSTVQSSLRQKSASHIPSTERSTLSAYLESRPSTAPHVLYKTYAQTESPTLSRQLMRTPGGQSTKYIDYHFDENMTKIHRQNCYIPSEHSIDVHNAFSPVHGPHTNIHSLLGPPPVPRPMKGVFHSSAFYHAPGRYPTPSKPYPPRRSQSRLSSSSYRITPVPVLVPFNSLPWDRNI